MNITVNGQPKTVVEQATVAALLEHLSLNPEHLVVELNQRIIMPEEFTATPVTEGDRLELIQFVGGG